MRPRHKIPADFASVCGTKTVNALRLHYGVAGDVILRWCRETGLKPLFGVKNVAAPLPDDFRTVAPNQTKAALQRHYGVSEKTINRWLSATGMDAGRRYEKLSQRKPLPDDFADVAPGLSQRELTSHYNASRDVVLRWLREAGVQSLGRHRPRQSSQPRRIVFDGHARTLNHRDMRHITMYDEAADVLRRERFVVFRCGPTGKYLEKGLHWRVGNTVCTPDELLQRAARYRSKAA